MDKLTMAHEYAKILLASSCSFDGPEHVATEAWDLADAMQAEADKRKEKGFPESIRFERFERSEAVSSVVELAEKQGLLKRGSWDDE